MAVRSSIVRRTSEDGKYFAGATRGSGSDGKWVHDSSRWGNREDANDYLESVKSIRPGFHFEILTSPRPPEIFRHCGEVAQALGCKCPGCGTVLTQKDARDWAKEKKPE